jgi:hypothetical protein
MKRTILILLIAAFAASVFALAACSKTEPPVQPTPPAMEALTPVPAASGTPVKQPMAKMPAGAAVSDPPADAKTMMADETPIPSKILEPGMEKKMGPKKGQPSTGGK